MAKYVGTEVSSILLEIVAPGYTVSFDPNCDDYAGVMEDEDFVYGEAKALTENGYVRPGSYGFFGWNTAADGSGTSYDDGQIVQDLTSVDGATVTLYARWGDVTLAAGSTWYKSSMAKTAITGVTMVDSYTPTGDEDEVWNADVGNLGCIKCYRTGTEIIMAGSGAGKIWANQNSASAFAGFTGLVTLDGTELLDTSRATNMTQMFYNDGALVNPDLSNWDVSHVEIMTNMFNYCYAITELDLSDWDVGSVTNMGAMFTNNKNLASVGDLSGWNTGSLQNASSMFYNTKLESLDLSAWDVHSLERADSMFSNCKSLTSVGDISAWNTVSLMNTSGMFNSTKITELDLSGWDTSNLTNTSQMFIYCGNLADLDLSGWDTSAVTSSSAMFTACYRLQEVTIGEDFTLASLLPTPSGSYIKGANGTWYSLTTGMGYTPATIPADTADTYVALRPAPMLAPGDTWYKSSEGRNTITSIELVDSYTPRGSEDEVWNADAGNSGSIKCYRIGGRLIIAGNNSGGIGANPDSSFAFSSSELPGDSSCEVFSALESITGTNLLNMSRAEDVSNMFAGCASLEELDVSTWNMSKVTDMENMFADCASLEELDASAWNTGKVTDMSGMFSGCASLENPNVSAWSTGSVTDMSGMFSGCESLAGVNVSSWNTSHVTDMSSMFENCGSVERLDFSGWNTCNVTESDDVFAGCHDLKLVTLGKDFTLASELPVPSNAYIQGADGYWYSTTSGQGYTPANIPANTADTYSAVSQSGPVLLPNDTWYKSSEDRSTITHIAIVDSYLPTGEEDESWKADVADVGNIMCYRIGSEIIIAGNGAETIRANPSSENAFSGFSALRSIDGLDVLDTMNVENMNKMFQYCSSLESLDFSEWDTGSVTDSNDMFFGCRALRRVTIGEDFTLAFRLPSPSSSYIAGADGKWYSATTGEGYNPSDIPANTEDTYIAVLKTLAAGSTWYKSSMAKTAITGVTMVDSYTPTGNEDEVWNADAANMGDIKCYRIGTEIIMAGCGEGKIWANANSEKMFDGFSNLKTVTGADILELGKTTTIASMFNGCSKLEEVDVSNWDTSNVASMASVFSGCSKLKEADVSDWDTSKVANMSATFKNCSTLTELDVSDWDVSQVTTMSEMFYNCKGLTELDVSEWDTGKSGSMTYMFASCSNLKELDTTDWDTHSLKNTSLMFQSCSKLESIGDVSGWNMSSVTTPNNMFYGCSVLAELDVSDWDMHNAGNMGNMFGGCTALTELDVSKWNTGKATSMASMFYGCSGLTELDVSGWDVHGVANTSNMFYNCSGLTELDLSEWDTGKVTNTGGMFYGCSGPTTVYVGSGWTVEGVTSSSNMFYGCTSIVGSEGTVYSDSYRDKTRAHIDGGEDDPGYLTSSAGYIITFDANGGTGTSQQIVPGSSRGGSVTLSPDMVPTRSDGYAFAGWNTAADGSGTTYMPGASYTVPATGDGVTLYVVWEAKTALLTTGQIFNQTVKNMASYETENSAVKNIVFGSMHDPEYASIVSTYGGSAADVSAAGDGSIKAYNCGGETVYVLADIPVGGKINANADSGYMFNKLSGLTSVNVSALDTSSTTDMNHMFSNCSGLTELDVSEWDTSNVTTMRTMFQNCSALTELDLSGFDTSIVTDMGFMFNGCSGLTELDVSNFDTGSVTNMRSMFADCSRLAELDVRGFDTRNVTDMYHMFYNCSGLTELDVSGFNTHSVMDMRAMFYECNSLTELDVSGFETGLVTDMGFMFQNCSALTELDVSGWDTGSVTDMKNMFSGAGLTELDVSGFNTGGVTTMAQMFWGCTDLTKLDLSSWNTSKVTSSDGVFTGCRNLQEVTLGESFTLANKLPAPSSAYISDADGKWYSGTTDIGYTPATIPTGTADTYFAVKQPPMLAAGDTWYKSTAERETITHIEITDSYTPDGSEDEVWNADVGDLGRIKCYRIGSEIIIAGNGSGSIKANPDSSFMFSNSDILDEELCDTCTEFWYLGSITGAELLDTSEVTNMFVMFYDCESLEALDVSDWDTGKVTDMSDMFCMCTSLTELDVSDWDTAEVLNMCEMFCSCSSLRELDLSSWDVSSVTDMSWMFCDCESLEALDIFGWDTGEVLNMCAMFYDCTLLTELDVPDWDTGKVTDMNGMFAYCTSLTELDVSDWDTGNVTAMYDMFSGCESLEELDVFGWDTGEVLNMCAMFCDCTSLTELDMSGWDTGKVTDMSWMFYDCTSLGELDFSEWDTGNVEYAEDMFYDCPNLQKVTIGENFTLASELPEPDSTYIPKANGKWYSVTTETGYAPENIPTGTADTYVAVLSSEPGTLAAGWVVNHEINGSRFYEYYEETVKHIIFGSIYDPQYASVIAAYGENAFDVSEAGDGSVKAYANGGENVYVLADIPIDGKIKANKDSSYMFCQCGGITELDLSYLDVSGVTNMEAMFDECRALTELDLSDWDTSSVTNMSRMFYECYDLTELDLNGFDTSGVTDMSRMFESCEVLEELDLSGWDTSKVTSSDYMFTNCLNLQEVTLGEDFTLANLLPAPSSTYISGADGKWYSVTTEIGYTPANIPTGTEDTYVAVKPAFDILMVVMMPNDPEEPQVEEVPDDDANNPDSEELPEAEGEEEMMQEAPEETPEEAHNEAPDETPETTPEIPIPERETLPENHGNDESKENDKTAKEEDMSSGNGDE